jgi:hypothetical protein
LERINNDQTSIAIYEREVDEMTKAIKYLVERGIRLDISGDIDFIGNVIKESLDSDQCKLLVQDIINLAEEFSALSTSANINVLLETVIDDMCTRFHADLNDLRLLCTYYGPGTLWLKEDNINRQALNEGEDNCCIVIDPEEVQQVKTGAVAILKGSRYMPQLTGGAVHQSPSVEGPGQRRLLLRIDTN